MTLYLIRHAHAVTAEENPLRPLSARGRGQVAHLVAYFRQSGTFVPAEIWCSSLVRSRETASLLIVGLKLSASLLQCPDLEPDADPRRMIARIASAAQPLAIVGHEPHLGALAGQLLEDSNPVTPFVFKKGAVLALTDQPKPWRQLWQISPDLLDSPRAHKA